VHGGLTLSIMLHGILLAWALISFQATRPLKPPEVQPVEVAIISPDDLVRLRKGVRESKKLETRPAKNADAPQKKLSKTVRKVAPPPPAAAEPPEVPVTVKPEPPKPSEDDIAAKLAALEKNKATEEAKLKAEAERRAAELAQKKAAEEAKRKAAEAKEKAEADAKRKAEAAKRKAEAAKRKAEERRKKRLADKRRREQQRKLAEKRRRARERKKKFDANKIAALLNKIPDAKSPPAGSQHEPKTSKPLPSGPAAGAPEGRDERLTASQRSLLGVMMKRAVSPCWHVQTGMQGADQLVVELEVWLKPDGTLDGEPRVVEQRGGALFADAATNAIRALRQCAPYNLPRALYKDGWDHMVVTFDPQKMF
jgi:colicin import membrane protein